MKSILALIRPPQWIKNIVVLAGVVFAGRLGDPEFVLRALQTVLIVAQWKLRMPFGVFMAAYASLFLICTLALVLDLKRSGHFDLGWEHRWLPGSRFSGADAGHGSSP